MGQVTGKYRSALLGLGNIAWKLGQDRDTGSSLSHAAAYAANPATQLVAGYSPHPDDSKPFQGQYDLPVYQDIERMLSEQQPDIVSVCSPTAFHYEQVSLLLDKGIPMIWLEKPPAEDAGQLHDLLQQCSRGQSKVLVNYQRRYTSSYRQLRKLVHDGTYGDVIQIEICYSKGLLTNGSHMLDLIFFLTGNQGYQIEWVDQQTGNDNPSFLVRLQNNVMVFVCGNELPYHNLDIVITCERARLSVLHGGMTTRVELMAEHELFSGYYRLHDSDNGLLGEGGFAHANDLALVNLIDAHEQNIQPDSNLESASLSQQLAGDVTERACQP